MDKCEVILYHSGNKVSFDQLSLALLYKQQNYNVTFYTPVKRGEFHNVLDQYEVSYFGIISRNYNTFQLILNDIKCLVFAIKKNKPKLVMGSLPLNNLILSLLSFIFRANVNFITVRHHVDYILKGSNMNAKIIDCLVNWFSPKIQVISDRSYVHMSSVEKVNPRKLLRLNLYFDFSLFPIPDDSIVKQIKKRNTGKSLILSIGRLIPVKNHIRLLEVAKKMNKNLDFKLLILGEGPEFVRLNEYIDSNELRDYVEMIGFCYNVFDYIAASDLVVHLSTSENSLGVAKEVAFLEKPFLGYKSVGDSNVFLNSETGYCLPKNSSISKIAQTIKFALNDLNSAEKSKKMKSLMIKHFSGEKLRLKYLNLIDGK